MRLDEFHDSLPLSQPVRSGQASFLSVIFGCGLAAVPQVRPMMFRGTAKPDCYFGQDCRDSIGIPHPWQNLSPAMMRVPHLTQKPEARPGAGACACADGPWRACCTDACKPRRALLCLRASSTTAATRQISASQPEAVSRKL